MSSFIIVAGIMGYSIYKYCNKTSKYRLRGINDTVRNNENLVDNLLDRTKSIKEEPTDIVEGKI